MTLSGESSLSDVFGHLLLLLLLSHFSHVRLCDPIDSSLPGSSAPGILQARTLEWVTISFSYVRSLDQFHLILSVYPFFRIIFGVLTELRTLTASPHNIVVSKIAIVSDIYVFCDSVQAISH